jgi:hypothetical protein
MNDFLGWILSKAGGTVPRVCVCVPAGPPGLRQKSFEIAAPVAVAIISNINIISIVNVISFISVISIIKVKRVRVIRVFIY